MCEIAIASSSPTRRLRHGRSRSSGPHSVRSFSVAPSTTSEGQEPCGRATPAYPRTSKRRATDAILRYDGSDERSRTLVAIVGKLIRSEVERTMSDAAQRLGLTCEIHERPHLLSTQVASTVTGPRRKLVEFAEDLRREEILAMRAQGEVMLSPL
jgi:hypothetical protein